MRPIYLRSSEPVSLSGLKRRPLTRLNNDADARAPQGFGDVKRLKPLLHCNEAQRLSNTTEQIGSRLRDTLASERLHHVVAHQMLHREQEHCYNCDEAERNA